MIRRFFEQRMTRNTEAFWFVSVIYAVLFHGYLGTKYYADFYYSLLSNSKVMWIGTIGSYVAAIIGVIAYGTLVLLNTEYEFPFKWYDFVFAQLIGGLFVVLFGIIMIGLAIAAIIGIAVLILTLIVKLIEIGRAHV